MPAVLPPSWYRRPAARQRDHREYGRREHEQPEDEQPERNRRRIGTLRPQPHRTHLPCSSAVSRSTFLSPMTRPYGNGMRVLILGGTRFIGRRITAALMARGDDVTVVHRGDHEPAELAGCAHLHTPRSEFGTLADQVRAIRPDAVIDTLAMTRDDVSAV